MYQDKYLKYKTKYLELKAQIERDGLSDKDLKGGVPGFISDLLTKQKKGDKTINDPFTNVTNLTRKFLKISRKDKIENLNLGDYQIKVIDDKAFFKTKISSITLPPSLETIGDGAFSNCFNLNTVTVNHSNYKNSQLKSIGNNAFFKTKISSIILPPSLKTIGIESFANCESLSSVRFEPGSKLQSIGGEAFYNSGIASIIIPASVKTIGSRCFANCKSLSSVTFEPGSELETIENQAFSALGIESIILPPSLKTIGIESFANCKSLSSVRFENYSSIKFSKSIFEYCTKLKNIYLLEDIDDEKKNILKETWKLNKDVNIGIDTNLFKINEELTREKFRNELNEFIENKNNEKDFIDILFHKGDKKYNISQIILDNDNESEQKIGDLSKNLKTVIFGEDTKIGTIGFAAFRESKFETLIFGKNVEIDKIDQQCFVNCKNLKTVVFNENVSIDTIDALAFLGSGIESITIPSSIKVIGSNCFTNCKSLSSVTFENFDNLIINNNPFHGCINLKTLNVHTSNFNKETIKEKIILPENIKINIKPIIS